MMAFCFRAGLNFDIPFGQYFSFQPELLFATRGGGYKAEGNHAEHLYYMDVPLNVKLSKRMNLSKTMTGRPFVSLGPVLSLGMYGTSKCDGHTSHPMQNDADDEMKMRSTTISISVLICVWVMTSTNIIRWHWATSLVLPILPTMT